MSRSNRQIHRLIQELVRAVQTGRIKLRWIVAIVVLAAGYLLLHPMLERSLGVKLPGFDDLVANSPADDSWTSSPPVAKETSRDPRNSSSDEIERILKSGRREVYTSAAGLRYTRGSQHGHRLKHLMAHTRDEPNRPGQHGVFDSDDPSEVIGLVDEAYLQAQSGRDTRTQTEGERIVYDVNLRRRVGYIGGEVGNRRSRPVAKHVRLVVEGDRLITAFPIVP